MQKYTALSRIYVSQQCQDIKSYKTPSPGVVRPIFSFVVLQKKSELAIMKRTFCIYRDQKHSP